MFYRYWDLLFVLGGKFLSTASDIGGHAFNGLGSCGKPSSATIITSSSSSITSSSCISTGATT